MKIVGSWVLQFSVITLSLQTCICSKYLGGWVKFALPSARLGMTKTRSVLSLGLDSLVNSRLSNPSPSSLAKVT